MIFFCKNGTRIDNLDVLHVLYAYTQISHALTLVLGLIVFYVKIAKT